MTDAESAELAASISSGGGRPAKYRRANGDVVPGVTTVLGSYKDPGGLIHWAWKLGCNGKDYRKVRDDAGDVGHVVHGWIEDSIHGRDPHILERGRYPFTNAQWAAAEMAFDAFLKWRAVVSLQIIDTERPLVSELHSYGGTYDALAIVNGVVSLLDWKTGAAIYPETIAQLAAYRQLIRENCGTKREHCPERADCLRVGKELGDFHHHGYNTTILDAGWRRFLGAKMMWDEDKVLKGVCR